MALVYVLLGIVILAGFVALLLALAYVIIILFQLVAEEVSDIC